MGRFIRKLLTALLLLPILLVGLVYAVLQFDSGREKLLIEINRFTAGQPMQVRLEHLTGHLPDELYLGHIQLLDKNGVWLEIENLSLGWSPLQLISGKLLVSDLSVDRINILRQPELPPAEDETPQPMEWPPKLPPVEIQNLAIQAIEISSAVAGKPVNFGLQAKAESKPDTGSAEVILNVTQKGDSAPIVQLMTQLQDGLEQLSIELKVEDPGGLISSFSNDTQQQPLSLVLTGTGPLQSWQGELTARAEGLAKIESDITLDLRTGNAVSLKGEVHALGQLLSPELTRFFADGINFSAQIEDLAKERIHIREFTIAAVESLLKLQGTVQPKDQQMNLQLHAVSNELAQFDVLTEAKLGGQLELQADLRGSFQKPTADLSIKGKALRVNEAVVAELTTELHLQSTALKSVQLVGSGQVVKIEHQQLPAPVDQLEWALESELERQQLSLQKLSVKAAGVELKSTGKFNLDHQQGELNSHINIANLASLEPFTGIPDNGRVQVTLSLDIAQKLQQLVGQFDVVGSELAGLFADLTGEESTLTGRFNFLPDKQLSVEGLELKGKNITLDGTLKAGLHDSNLEGLFNLAVEDLEPFSTLLGQPIAGTLQSNLVLAGQLAQPRVELNVRGHNLAVSDRGLGNMELRTNLKGTSEQNLKGEFALTAKAPEGTLNAAADYTFSPENFALSNVQVSGPGTSITGWVSSPLPVIFPSGILTGELHDLSALSPWLGKGYKGQIAFTLDAPTDNPKQQALIHAEAKNISTPFGQLKQLQAEVEASDVINSPRLKADVKLQGFDNRGGVRVDQLDTTVTGSPGQLELTGNFRGQHEGAPFTFKSNASLVIEDQDLHVALSRFEGTYDELPIRLLEKLRLSVLPQKQLLVKPFELQLGEGQLKAEAALSTTANSATVEADLPLSLLSSFGGPQLTGNTLIAFKLAGTADNPNVDATLNLVDFESVSGPKELPPISMTTRVRLNNGLVNLNASTSDLSNRASHLQLQLPVKLIVNPFTFTVPEQAAVQGKVDLEVDLARVAKALALKDPILEGLLDLDLELMGTRSDPTATGSATLSQGVVSSVTTGTLLENFKLKLKVEGRQFKLQALSASDGSGGKLGLSGEVDLTLLDNPKFNMQLALERAHLLRLPEVSAILSGGVEMKGELRDMLIEGKLIVDEAKIKLPENRGPSIPEIKVTELNAPGEEKDEDISKNAALNVVMNIAVDMPGQIFVRGRGLDSEWGGGLKIKGSASEPNIVGDISIRRGRFDFLNRRFDLREGTIQFSGAMPPEPYLDLQTASELSELTAIVHIRGLATKPEILLSSDPERPQDEILAQILFDRGIQEITPLQAAKLAAAVNQLRGGKGFDPVASLRDSTGLDDLDVGVDESGNVSVTAGTYIDEKTYLQFKPGMGSAGSKLSVEREINRKFSADVEVEDDGGTSLGLGWKFEY